MSSPLLPSLLLFFFLFLHTNPCNGSDSITSAKPLVGNHTITSKGGIFELGFFTPSSSSQNYYIGIWYKQIPLKTVIWVANRIAPLPKPTNSVLKISEDGNLALLGPSNLSVWSTNLTSRARSNSTVAVLLDSGNLVLRDEKNPAVIHWQSFAHPTDRVVPGNWIGIKNKATGENARFISWKSKEDPAPGPFSYEVDPNQNQVVYLWNGTEMYYNSGVWNPETFSFSGVPEMVPRHRLACSFVDSKTEKYLICKSNGPTTFAHTVVDVSGTVRQYSWSKENNQWNLFWSRPRYQCDVYAVCGTNW